MKVTTDNRIKIKRQFFEQPHVTEWIIENTNNYSILYDALDQSMILSGEDATAFRLVFPKMDDDMSVGMYYCPYIPDIFK